MIETVAVLKCLQYKTNHDATSTNEIAAPMHDSKKIQSPLGRGDSEEHACEDASEEHSP